MSSDFTGERYIPGQGGCQIAYEHLHRYLFALRWAAGKQVLDVACGVGYGAALLSRRARHVWAIELDEGTIQSASKAWGGDNLSYVRGDVTKLPFRTGSMELVVAMEILEHVRDQEGLVQEIARVCSADGVVLISTPNKTVYSDAREYVNPFHICELYLEEFISLLKRHFSHVQLMHQQIRAGSFISCATSSHESEIITEPAPDPAKPEAGPMYFLAICGNRQIAVPSGSAYLDCADGLFNEWKEELGRWAKALQCDLEERDRTIQNLQAEMKEEIVRRDRAIQSFQVEMKEEIVRRDRHVSDLMDLLQKMEKEYDDRGGWALSLQNEVEMRDATIRRISGELNEVQSHLARIRRAFLYRVLRRLGVLPE